MTSNLSPPRLGIGHTFGRLCRDTRITLDVSQQRLADRVGVSRSHIGRIERGAGDPSVHLIEAIADALGIGLDLVARRPIVHGRDQPRDGVHAWCSAYADRRLRSLGLATAREVEVVHARSHGWIDLLAFDRRTGTLFVIEIKTRLDDIGAIERQLHWYERSAWQIANDLGWSPRRVRTWLLVLASEEVDRSLLADRDLFDRAFPGRAPSMTLESGGATADDPIGHSLAMVDPANRGRQWLLKTRLDGRRSPARYRGYADAIRR